MGVVAELSTLALQIYKVWLDRNGGVTLSPQKFHDKYIAPSYQLLRQVHDDYLQVYLELEERLALEDTLSDVTIRWFLRARVRRQADRSELRFFEIPPLEGRTDRAKSLMHAASRYLEAVRAYFDPLDDVSDILWHRLRNVGPTAFTYTELRLRLLKRWLSLPPESQRALAAEEYIERYGNIADRSHDAVIEGVMQGVLGRLDTQTSEHLEAIHRAVHGTTRTEEDHCDEFGWRNILNEHTRIQRLRFEWRMADVQRAYVLFRILSDR